MSYLFYILFLMSFGHASDIKLQTEKSPVTAKITTVRDENKVVINAIAINNTTNSYKVSYILLVEKNKNRGGNRSNNRQHGTALVKQNEIKKLSATSINRSPKDVLYISLRMYDENNKLLSEDTLALDK